MPLPSSPYFAAFTTRPRTAWRPITALQRRNPADGPVAAAASSTGASASDASAPVASSSASDMLSSLESLLTGLHPHAESTDIQLQHILGADWSALSMSQLNVLDDIYSSLSRQIRDAQFQLHHASTTQDFVTEIVRTRSELHALRKEVEELRAQNKDGASA